jgi:hypothetical protein
MFKRVRHRFVYESHKFISSLHNTFSDIHIKIISHYIQSLLIKRFFLYLLVVSVGDTRVSCFHASLIKFCIKFIIFEQIVHDPPIRTLILTDISCAVQIKLIIMRFSSAYSHAFILRLKYSPDYLVLKNASCKVYTVKADSHIACRAHAVPMLCRALIQTCHAVPLPCSNTAVSFVKIHVVAGNIQTASPTV